MTDRDTTHAPDYTSDYASHASDRETTTRQLFQANPGINRLLDEIKRDKRLANDTALAKALLLTPPSISRLRRGNKLGATVLLRIHEATGMHVREIRKRVAGDAGAV